VAKRILVLLLLSFTGAFAQTDTPISAALKWKNVSSQYKTFDQIKPVLLNEGKESVFLSRIYPHGSAQLSRFNEGTRKWNGSALTNCRRKLTLNEWSYLPVTGA
jgi:hypothetical protein